MKTLLVGIAYAILMTLVAIPVVVYFSPGMQDHTFFIGLPCGVIGMQLAIAQYGL